MSQLFIIGGSIDSSYKTLRSCYIYNLNFDKWNQITDLNKERFDADCTVFESKIVVTGGDN